MLLFHTASAEKQVGPGNKAICSHMTSRDMANGHTGLVPRPLPLKVERGSGVLSDISCHMGRGLWRKECHIKYDILYAIGQFTSGTRVF